MGMMRGELAERSIDGARAALGGRFHKRSEYSAVGLGAVAGLGLMEGNAAVKLPASAWTFTREVLHT